MAAMTFSRVEDRTEERELRARLTVAVDTPARAATS
jgi:hypothetical protein